MTYGNAPVSIVDFDFRATPVGGQADQGQRALCVVLVI
jgi:hypothetical protein